MLRGGCATEVIETAVVINKHIEEVGQQNYIRDIKPLIRLLVKHIVFVAESLR
jgi:hypothetical protein